MSFTGPNQVAREELDGITTACIPLRLLGHLEELAVAVRANHQSFSARWIAGKDECWR